MKVLVIDNYDSFTYNLVHIIRDLGFELSVYRNDRLDMDLVKDYDKILLSPGPGIPDEAGLMKEIIRSYGQTKSIFGVCLGHQGIAEVYGAQLYNLPDVLHGVTSRVSITNDSEKIFRGVPENFTATHYHSWAVNPEFLGDELEVTAVNNSGIIMALRHRRFDVRGVQFHPESIMTEHGIKIMENWLLPELG